MYLSAEQPWTKEAPGLQHASGQGCNSYIVVLYLQEEARGNLILQPAKLKYK